MKHRALIAAALALSASVSLAEPPPPGEGEHAVEDAVETTVRRAAEGVSPRSLKSYVDHLASYTTRHTLSRLGPRAGEIGEARNWIETTFERATRGGRRDGVLRATITQEPHTIEPDGKRFLERIEIRNVVCVIPGSMPEAVERRYYAIAHYDSRASLPMDATSAAPGANDDASGVAVLLELARVLARERLDSTIILMATAGEEQGLFGARGHAEALGRGGYDIRAVLNNDTVGDPTGPGGRSAPTEIRIFSEGLPAALFKDEERLGTGVRALRRYASESDSPSRQLARYIAEVAERHSWLPVKPRLVFRPDRYLRGGDHTAFNEQGFAAVRLTEVYEHYDRQHQDVREENGRMFGDTPDHVDPIYLAGVAQLNAATLIHLANAPTPPPETRIIVAGLANDTTLRWSPSPEPDVAGYEIVWRDTTAALWEHSLDVGDVNEHTLDLSKDNWIFGVRAYDAGGFKSPVSMPTAARE
ncbi:MAG: M28 family metallopeptidase [Planctomycetota bacterium]